MWQVEILMGTNLQQGPTRDFQETDIHMESFDRLT